MRVMRLEVIVVDTDNIGEKAIREAIEHSKYPNWCITARVRGIETRDIGEWNDDHPLNRRDTAEEELNRLFGKANQ